MGAFLPVKTVPALVNRWYHPFIEWFRCYYTIFYSISLSLFGQVFPGIFPEKFIPG